MAKAFTAELVGVDKLFGNTARLEQALSGPDLDAATEDAAEVFEDIQVSLVPRDSGDLAASITRQNVRRERRVSEWDTGPSKKGFYGLFLELGTFFQSPQPFMRPAFDEGKAAAEQTFRARLSRSIKLVLRG